MAESRLFCNEFTQASDAETLIKVLTELREYDRAICLAREARTCLYCPVMKMMSEYCQPERQDQEESKQSLLERLPVSRDETEWLNQGAREANRA